MARYQFKFWLDANKDDELLLAEEIDILKRQRSYTSAIRDGIRLIVDLRAGRIDVLCELFPWVQDRLKAANGGGDSDLKEKISQIEKLLVLPGSQQVMQPVGAPKPLAAGPVKAPVFDDDDGDLLIVRKSTSAGNNASQNFLKAAFALQNQTYQ